MQCIEQGNTPGRKSWESYRAPEARKVRTGAQAKPNPPDHEGAADASVPGNMRFKNAVRNAEEV
jgi:hypothetical protein